MQTFVTEVERAAVVGLEDEEADDLAREFLKDVLDRKEVVLRLRHLLVVDRNKAVVQPIARKFLIAVNARLRLRNLILVVREDEVVAAAVEVEGITEVFHGHRRALDVPAGTTLSPRTLP